MARFEIRYGGKLLSKEILFEDPPLVGDMIKIEGVEYKISNSSYYLEVLKSICFTVVVLDVEKVEENRTSGHKSPKCGDIFNLKGIGDFKILSTSIEEFDHTDDEPIINMKVKRLY